MTKRNFKLGDKVYFTLANLSKASIGYLLGEGIYATEEKFWIIGYYNSTLKLIDYSELCTRTYKAGIPAEKRINMLKYEELENITSLVSTTEKNLSFINFKIDSLLSLKDNY